MDPVVLIAGSLVLLFTGSCGHFVVFGEVEAGFVGGFDKESEAALSVPVLVESMG